jgi:hypothetical protein
MRTILISLLSLFALNAVQAQSNDACIKLIRSAYAKSKEKIEQNGKNGRSPWDMTVIVNSVNDEEAEIYDRSEITYYFDETIKDYRSTKRPYFLIEKWTSHQHVLYHEMLFNPEDSTLMFSYRRGETDGGFVVESRYYYDAQGKLIEQKHNTPNTWSDADSEQVEARHFMKIFRMVNTYDYLSANEVESQSGLMQKDPARIKHIRSVYAQAKDKVAKDDAKGDIDDGKRSIHITVRDGGEQGPPTTTERHIYFDTVPYYVSYCRSSMSYNGYAEYLYEPGTTDLIFSYSGGQEENETREWRYYYNKQGFCIDVISNAEEIDYGYSDRMAAKDYIAIFRALIGE